MKRAKVESQSFSIFSYWTIVDCIFEQLASHIDMARFAQVNKFTARVSRLEKFVKKKLQLAEKSFYEKLIKERSDEELVCYPKILLYKNDASEEFFIQEALRWNAEGLLYIENPSEELKLHACHTNRNALKYIENPTFDQIQAALYRFGADAAKHLDDIPIENKRSVLRTNGSYVLTYINPTEEIYYFAINLKPFAIRYIKNQTLELCRFASQLDARVLPYCRFQDEDMVVRYLSSGETVWYMENIRFQNERICEMMMEIDPKNFKYTKYRSERVWELAIRHDPVNFRLVENPTEDFIMKALSWDHTIIEYVDNPTLEMVNLVLIASKGNFEFIKNRF